MKKLQTTRKWLLNALIAAGLMTAISSCKKTSVGNATPAYPKSNPEATDDRETGKRMWNPAKHIFGVGHNSSSQALLYSFTAPPALNPLLIAPFTVGTTPVTYAHGIACTGSTPSDNIIICTAAISNFPNSLLIYPRSAPYNSPTILPCPSISDIEFDEFSGVLYGILSKNRIVQINMTTGAVTTNYSPILPPGSQLRGLCNYNGLLSYSINDNTAGSDNFYSYNPASPASTPPLFSTDWGTNNEGGMQYCTGTGWVLVTSSSTKKTINASTLAATPFSTISGGPYFFSDLSSD